MGNKIDHLIGVYKHNKTGKLYSFLDEVINATNANDGQVMILYVTTIAEGPIYVREKEEFLTKFTKVNNDGSDSSNS